MIVHDLAVAVLAGGASRRMGVAKSTVQLPTGGTLGAAMVHLARAIGEHIVGIGAADALPDCPCVPDNHRWRGCGPLAGIEAALATGAAHRWLVLPCDMPALQVHTLQQLVDVEAPLAALGPGPLPLVIDSALLPQVREALEQHALALRDFVQANAGVTLPLDDATQLQNINTPDDLRA